MGSLITTASNSIYESDEETDLEDEEKKRRKKKVCSKEFEEKRDEPDADAGGNIIEESKEDDSLKSKNGEDSTNDVEEGKSHDASFLEQGTDQLDEIISACYLVMGNDEVAPESNHCVVRIPVRDAEFSAVDFGLKPQPFVEFALADKAGFWL